MVRPSGGNVNAEVVPWASRDVWSNSNQLAAAYPPNADAAPPALRSVVGVEEEAKPTKRDRSPDLGFKVQRRSL